MVKNTIIWLVLCFALVVCREIFDQINIVMSRSRKEPYFFCPLKPEPIEEKKIEEPEPLEKNEEQEPEPEPLEKD